MQAIPRWQYVTAAVLDLVAVTLFVTGGRSTHDEPVGLIHILGTLWPFATGLTIGWLALRVWKNPLAPVRVGLPLALVTCATGMVLRFITQQGTALAFIGVATAFLVVTLVGWRMVVGILVRNTAATT